MTTLCLHGHSTDPGGYNGPACPKCARASANAPTLVGDVRSPFAELALFAEYGFPTVDHALAVRAERDTARSELSTTLNCGSTEAVSGCDCQRCLVRNFKKEYLARLTADAERDAAVRERDGARQTADARFDCKGGPGTTSPRCGGCVSCLLALNAELEGELKKVAELVGVLKTVAESSAFHSHEGNIAAEAACSNPICTARAALQRAGGR